jgi:xanthine/CO dehydrogenase XdhC/CoxF family maturation factor
MTGDPSSAPTTELDKIVESILGRDTDDFALATVVGTRGSTYRGLGARQLVRADGVSVGTVSGGCLDSDLRAVAERVMAGGVAEIVTFDLTADDEAIWGWGIGCNGVTELLVEPAASARPLAHRIVRARAEQRPLAVVHDLSRPGRRWFVDRADSDGPDEIARAATSALDEGWPRVEEISGVRYMIEVVGAPSRLVVCGAGHDASPVVEFGARLGFEVTVVDDRRQFLTRERFPQAARLVHSRPSALADAVELDSRTYVVLMSHNYLRDLDYLRAVLGTDVAYIAALGPGERLRRLLADLEEQGIRPTEADLAKLHGPAGLDIGAEGPDEIAWAIMAEILAVRRGKPGGRLRDRKGPKLIRTGGDE